MSIPIRETNPYGTEHYPGGKTNLHVLRMPRLSPQQAKVEETLANLVQNPERVDAIYDSQPGTENGKILGVEFVRRLAPEYNQSQATFTPATINPALAYVKDRLQRSLRNPLRDRSHLVILSGGPGSGKTTCLDLIKRSSYDLIMDCTLARFDTAIHTIDLALDKGWIVSVVHIYRPYSLAVKGMLWRAQNQGRYVGFGKGRSMGNTHYGSRSCFRELYHRYHQNQKVILRLIDNTDIAYERQASDILLIEDLTQEHVDADEETGIKVFVEEGGDPDIVDLCYKGSRSN